MRTMLVSIRRALLGAGFIIGALGVMIVACLAAFEYLYAALRAGAPVEGGYCVRLALTVMRSDAMRMSLPILCALPFASSFVDDIKSGFIKAYLPRAGVNGYILGKSFACALSGGLSVALGLAMAACAFALALSPLEAYCEPDAALYPLVLRGALLYFMSGALWAVAGLTLSALTLSKYMAYAAPFVVYYTLVILYDRYFTRMYIICPREWLEPSLAWRTGALGVILLVAILISALMRGFSHAAERRLSRL